MSKSGSWNPLSLPLSDYTLRSLLDRGESDPDVREAHSDILKKGWAYDILKKQNPDGSWESAQDLYRPKYTASNWRMIDFLILP